MNRYKNRSRFYQLPIIDIKLFPQNIRHYVGRARGETAESSSWNLLILHERAAISGRHNYLLSLAYMDLYATTQVHH
jgi:hypothetical protein